jgi:hypothetical protein
MAKTQRRNRKGTAPRKATAAVKRRARAAGTRPAAKSRATARKAAKARPTAKKAKKPARSVAKGRPAPRAVKKAVGRKVTTARRVARKTTTKVARKASPAVRRTARVAAPIARKSAPAAKKAAAAAPRKAAPRKAAPKKVAAAPKTMVVAKAAPVAKQPRAAVAAKPVRKAPALDRERRTVGEPEMVPMPPSSLVPGHASAARSGADELRMKMATHTGAGPVLTAGDVDADWGAAEAVGDEAPGGDNPTPDQDVVDEIGRALGVEYDDDEELQGGDEIAGRDRDRWELDPASSDDFDER